MRSEQVGSTGLTARPHSFAGSMRCTVALFGCLLVHGLVRGQAELLLTRLSVPDIENAQVRSAVMDRFGALWLATDRGVHRFDGSRTESYLNDPLDSLSLCDDSVFEVALAPDGSIWAATFAGAWRIEPFTKERRRIRLKHERGFAKNYECLGLAWGVDGALWAFCNRSGLAHMVPGSDHLVVAQQMERTLVSGGWVAPDGVVWYTDRQDLVALDPRTSRVEVHPFSFEGRSAPPKTLLLGVVPDAHDPASLWCTSWGLGLVRFNTITRSFDMQIALDRPLDDLRNIVRHAVQRGPFNWWLIMDGKLCEMDARNGALVRWSGVEAASHKGHTVITTLDDGSVMIGGHGEVFAVMSSSNGPTALTDEFANKPSQITPSRMDEGHWLVSFYNDRRLVHLNATGQIVADLPLPVADRVYEPFRVKQTSDGTVWVATTYGLMRHQPGTNSIDLVPVEKAGAPDARPFVNALLAGPTGTLWAVLSSSGLLRWDLAADSGAYYSAPPLAEGGNSLLVGVEAYDGEHLLLDLAGNGPMLFHIARGEYIAITGARLPVAHFRAMTAVKADDQGRIYALTRSHGVMRLVRGADGWYIERRWLPPERPVFERVAEDGRGRMWLVSTTGSYLIDPATDIMHKLDPLHGFPFTELGGIAEGRSGEVLVHAGTWHRTGPEFIPKHRDAVLMLREAYAAELPLDLSALIAEGIQLPASKNDIHLVFGVVSLFEGDAFNYAYRIARDGEEGSWAELGRQRSFSLLDLQPGTYAVELRAESPSSRPVSMALRVTILPPWWGTWWARAILVGAAVLLVVLLTRTFLQRRYVARVRELERERELEKVRMRIARDIHDGIGSGLTKITMLSRQLDPASGPQAERIAEASTDLVSELGEIVWTVDPRNDSYSSFIAYVRNMLGRQFEHLQVQLRSDLVCAQADRERNIGPELKRNILLVLKEAVSNALKHSGAQLIEVQLVLGETGAILQVRDNGRGFDPQRIREGAIGLANFSRRAEALGGTVHVDTGPGGTTVTLKVPSPSTKM